MVRGLWHCDIVAPPQDVVDAYAEQRFRLAVGSFRSDLRFILDDYVKARPLPSSVTPCPTYDPDPKHFTWEDEDDGPATFHPPEEHEARYHSHCRNCKGGMYKFTCDLEELFLAHGDALESRLRPGWTPLRKGKPEKPKQKPVLSVAPPLDPNRTLYVAWPRHGDHSDGNVIEEVTPEMLQLLPFLQEYNSPLFFFHGELEKGEPDWAKNLKKWFAERVRASGNAVKAKHHHLEKQKREARFALVEEILGPRP